MTDLKVSKEQVSTNIQAELKSNRSDFASDSSDSDEEKDVIVDENFLITARA